MAGSVTNYTFGKDGVNLVKSPLQLGDGEATQLQNAELVPDANVGGEGSLSKRGGYQALNSVALAGTVLGMIGLSLKTAYTRTLYAGRGAASANTFKTSTDGTAWTNTALPLVPALPSKFTDANGSRDSRRAAAFRNLIVYPYDTYTKGSDNPPFAVWDGTDAYNVGGIPIGSSATAGTPAYAIVDTVTANGVLYFAVHDPGGSAPDLAGRVLSLNLETGVIKQVAAAFGNGTGQQAGGYPCCLCWYQDQLWVGLQGSTTTDGIGKVVRCYPDIAATWTADTSTLTGFPCSLAVYKGDLYAGVQSSTSSHCKVYKRTATTRAWAASFTSTAGTGDTGYCTSLMVYGTSLYAAEYHTVTPIIRIKAFDGSSWTTDRDVASTDSATTQMPGNAALLGSDLYYVFRATGDSATDGFILRKTSGAWSKVSTDNFGGALAVLVQRS